MSAKKLLKNGIIAAFWALVWLLLARRVDSELLLPGPGLVLATLWALVKTAAFWQSVALSMLRIVAGVAAAVTLGTLLAVVTERFSALRSLLSPALTVVKSTPVASFIILALVWMGRDVLPGFIALLMVLPVVWSNVSTGIAQTDPQLLEMARVFGFGPMKRLTKLYIPSVMPYFLSACRGSLGLGWKAGIAAEVLTLPGVSIGKRLYESKLYLETPQLFAWTLVVILLSLGMEKLLLAVLPKAERTVGK